MRTVTLPRDASWRLASLARATRMSAAQIVLELLKSVPSGIDWVRSSEALKAMNMIDDGLDFSTAAYLLGIENASSYYDFLWAIERKVDSQRTLSWHQPYSDNLKEAVLEELAQLDIPAVDIRSAPRAYVVELRDEMVAVPKVEGTVRELIEGVYFRVREVES